MNKWTNDYPHKKARLPYCCPKKSFFSRHYLNDYTRNSISNMSHVGKGNSLMLWEFDKSIPPILGKVSILPRRRKSIGISDTYELCSVLWVVTYRVFYFSHKLGGILSAEWNFSLFVSSHVKLIWKCQWKIPHRSQISASWKTGISVELKVI